MGGRRLKFTLVKLSLVSEHPDYSCLNSYFLLVIVNGTQHPILLRNCFWISRQKGQWIMQFRKVTILHRS